MKLMSSANFIIWPRTLPIRAAFVDREKNRKSLVSGGGSKGGGGSADGGDNGGGAG